MTNLDSDSLLLSSTAKNIQQHYQELELAAIKM